MKALSCVLVLLALLCSTAVSAHETKAGEITIDELTSTEARIALRSASAVALTGCALDGGLLRCPGGLAGRVLEIHGSDMTFVRYASLGGAVETAVVTRRAPSFVLPGEAPRASVVARFVGLGVEHVLTGIDHVLFLVALFWQAWTGRVRSTGVALARTATAFTLGHSLTLAATMLGVLHVRADVAEACIAWSLCLVAFDIGKERTTAWRGLLAAAFGLVHGLGFAGAIGGAALPDRARWTALVSFNLGIEAGQLLLFFACVAIVLVLRRAPRVMDRLTPACAWAVGVTGSTLFFLRVAAIFVVAALFLVARPARADENADDFRVARKPAARPDAVQPTPSQPGPEQPEKPPEPPKTWELTPFGYIRAGLDFTTKDDRFAFVGRNSGFVLDSARVGLDGNAESWNVAWRISIEGASDVVVAPNTPIGSLSVRLRDAFARWDPVPFIGLQVGQFKAPFQEEELRGTNTLLFASRAVGVEGVAPGRGFQTPGIQLDRQLGVMLSPARPIGGPAVAVSYYLMLMNGNGSNELLDDNGRFGIVGRTELGIYDYVRIGAAVFHNDRTVGQPPNLYDESDTGLTGDALLKVAGLSVFGAVTQVRTVLPTVGAGARTQLAFHGQAGYRFDLERWFIGPAYRFAYFHPWQSGGAEGFEAYRLQYHTLGVRAGLQSLPVQAWLNYTLTQEAEGRQLANDRLEVLGQVTF